MWDDSNQPPSPQYPRYQPPGQPSYQYQDDSGSGNTPTERFPDPDNPPPYAPTSYGSDPYAQPPQWPGPNYQRPQGPPAQPRSDPAYSPSPRQRASYDDEAVYAPPRPARERAATPQRSRAPRPSRSLPHLPIAHVLLILGVLAMWFAVTQPWGVDASGTQLFIHDFSNARLSARNIDAGALAVRTAYGIAIAAAVLSIGLILLNTVVTILNKMLGIIGLSGCASLVFFPVLWGGATLLFLVLLAGAGFAGLGALSNLPFVQDHGFALVSVQHNAIGFYIWCGGLGAVFIGMLGQLVLRRR